VFNGCQCGPGRPGRQDRQDVPGCQDAVGWVSEPWRRCKALNNRPPGKTACDPRLAVPNAKPTIGLVGGSGFRIELRLFAGPNGADEHTNHARTMPEPCRNHVGTTSESRRNHVGTAHSIACASSFLSLLPNKFHISASVALLLSRRLTALSSVADTPPYSTPACIPVHPISLKTTIVTPTCGVDHRNDTFPTISQLQLHSRR
jgi:hypothetical protein